MNSCTNHDALIKMDITYLLEIKYIYFVKVQLISTIINCLHIKKST